LSNCGDKSSRVKDSLLSELKDQLKKVVQENGDLRKRISELQGKLEETSAERNKMNAELKEVRDKLCSVSDLYRQ